MSSAITSVLTGTDANTIKISIVQEKQTKASVAPSQPSRWFYLLNLWVVSDERVWLSFTPELLCALPSYFNVVSLQLENSKRCLEMILIRTINYEPPDDISHCASHLVVITLSGELFFCSNNISLHLNFLPWRFTIYSNKLILIRKKFCRTIPWRKEWQKSVKSSLVFFLEKTLLELWDICLSKDE